MNSIIEKKVHILKDLCIKHQVKFMYVFGSATTSAFNEASDVDILIDFLPQSPASYADNYFALRYELESIFERSIDLVTQNSLHNPVLKDSIDKSKYLIYAA